MSRRYLAAALSRMGRQQEAEEQVAIARKDLPAISVAMLEQIEAYRAPEDQAHLSDAVRSAGLPDS